jgi:hypothetical protein
MDGRCEIAPYSGSIGDDKTDCLSTMDSSRGKGGTMPRKKTTKRPPMKAISKAAPVDMARKSQLSLDFEAKPKEAASPKRLVKRLQTLPKS